MYSQNMVLPFYDEKLKPILDLGFDKKYVAIPMDTEDYTIANSSGEAMRAIRKRHPTGWLVVKHIGTEPEWGLTGRLLADQMAAGYINFNLLSSTISRSNSNRGTKQ
jgi:hypothetical protein